MLMQKIGESWITQLEDLRKLEQFANDKNFLLALMRVKQVELTHKYVDYFQLIIRQVNC
jgi:hypothetical protein